MTITYPRELPTLKLAKADFRLVRTDQTSGEVGGRIVSNTLAMPYWSLDVATEATRDEYDLWAAWEASLRGAQKLFYGREFRRGRYPKAYRFTGFADLTRAGGGAFDGTATDFDKTDTFAPTFEGLPAGFQISIGDYVGFTFDGGRTLHRFTEAGVANGSGELTLALEAEVPGLVPVDAVATFDKPSCLMVITPGTFDASDDNARRTVSFQASSMPLEV